MQVAVRACFSVSVGGLRAALSFQNGSMTACTRLSMQPAEVGMHTPEKSQYHHLINQYYLPN